MLLATFMRNIQIRQSADEKFRDCGKTAAVMPGTRCCVSVCPNSLDKTRHTDKTISYHRFPKDTEIRNLWIERCNRSGIWNPNSCHICSVHFSTEDLITDRSVELLKFPYRRRLKSNAVPTLFLDESAPFYQDVKPLLPENRHYGWIDCDYDIQNVLPEMDPEMEMDRMDPLDLGDSKNTNDFETNDFNLRHDALVKREAPVSDSKPLRIGNSDVVKETSSVECELRRRKRKIKKLEYKIRILESRLRRAIRHISMSMTLSRRYSLCKRRKLIKQHL